MSRFVIRPVNSGIKFDLRAANGQTILTSEVYTTPAVCRKGIASVIRNAPIAKLEDQTEEGWKEVTNPKFQLYRDRAGDYRFRLRARNGEIIAVSENYSGRSGCLNGIESVRKNAAEAEIVEECAMDIKAKAAELVEKIRKDPALLKQFRENPVTVVEAIIGMDLPDDQIRQLAELIRAKIDLDKAGALLGSLFGRK